MVNLWLVSQWINVTEINFHIIFYVVWLCESPLSHWLQLLLCNLKKNFSTNRTIWIKHNWYNFLFLCLPTPARPLLPAPCMPLPPPLSFPICPTVSLLAQSRAWSTVWIPSQPLYSRLVLICLQFIESPGEVPPSPKIVRMRKPLSNRRIHVNLTQRQWVKSRVLQGLQETSSLELFEWINISKGGMEPDWVKRTVAGYLGRHPKGCSRVHSRRSKAEGTVAQSLTMTKLTTCQANHTLGSCSVSLAHSKRTFCCDFSFHSWKECIRFINTGNFQSVWQLDFSQ